MKKILIFTVGVLICVNSLGQKVKIYPRIIHELADYWSPAGDQNKPTGFFNEGVNLDPLNGVRTPPGGNDPVDGMPFHTYGGYYPTGVVNNLWYPGNRGLRIIFDMTGGADMRNMRKVNITDIYGWYNANLQAGDTMYFYNLDTMVTASQSIRWTFPARPDSLLTPFAKLRITNHFSGLLDSAVGLNINCRYLMIRAVLTDHGSFVSFPDFSELCIYGTDTNTTLVRRPATYAGALPKAKTFGKFEGTNQGTGYETSTFVNQGLVRTYGNLSYWDSTRAQTTTASCIFTPDYFPDVGPTQYPYFKLTGKIFWWTIRGPSQYLQSIHPGTPLNIDNYFADPEGPQYTRDAHFFGNYAALWGANASATGTSWAGSPALGKNKVNYVEPGNEGNFSWSVLVEYERLRMIYDSIKLYDPTFVVVMPATTEMDSGWVDNLCWFSAILDPGKPIPFDVINFHHYPRSFNYLGYAPTLAQQIGAYGASPEADATNGIYTNYVAYGRAVYNYTGDTSRQIWNTEYGYNNWGTPSTTTGQAQVPWAEQCVPSRGSFDSLQYKAILLSRAELIMPFSPVVGYNTFFLHNSTLSCTNDFSLFGACGDLSGHNSSAPFNATCFFPSWYYKACIGTRLKWYKPVSMTGITDTTGLIHQLWQKIDSVTLALTDSVCDIIWKPTSTASTASSQTVSIGYRIGNNLQKMVPSFTSLTGTTSSASVSGKNLFLTTQDEQPTLFFGRIAPDPGWWKFRFKAVFK